MCLFFKRVCTAVIKISDGVSLSEVQTVHIFTFARYISTIYEIVLMQAMYHCGVSLIECQIELGRLHIFTLTTYNSM